MKIYPNFTISFIAMFMLVGVDLFVGTLMIRGMQDMLERY